MVCGECGSTRMLRKRRSLAERFRYGAVYICADCNQIQQIDMSRRHPMLSLHACCPRCGTSELKKFGKIDHIEALYRNPVSRIQRLFGAPILYCQWCRLQFFDFRPRRT